MKSLRDEVLEIMQNGLMVTYDVLNKKLPNYKKSSIKGVLCVLKREKLIRIAFRTSPKKQYKVNSDGEKIKVVGRCYYIINE